jgi:hypothetical protein
MLFYMKATTDHASLAGITAGIRAFAECFFSGTRQKVFAESRIRQSPALGNELVYRVWDTRHGNTFGKDIFAEWQTLGKGDARQRAVSGRLKLTAVSLCRGPRVGTRQRPLYRVSSLDTRQNIFYFFNFGNQTFCGMFLHYVDLHVPF